MTRYPYCRIAKYKNNNIYMKLKVMVKEVEDGVCFEGFVVVGPVGLRVVGF